MIQDGNLLPLPEGWVGITLSTRRPAPPISTNFATRSPEVIEQDFRNASIDGGEMTLRVTNGSIPARPASPVYSQEQTLIGCAAMSERCQ
jgi:hypothetical protein